MKTTSWACDRCREPIVVGRVTLQTMTGPERLRRPEIDLCSQCTAVLWSWLDTPTPDPTGEAMGSRDEPDRSQGEA